MKRLLVVIGRPISNIDDFKDFDVITLPLTRTSIEDTYDSLSYLALNKLENERKGNFLYDYVYFVDGNKYSNVNLPDLPTSTPDFTVYALDSQYITYGFDGDRVFDNVILPNPYLWISDSLAFNVISSIRGKDLTNTRCTSWLAWLEKQNIQVNHEFSTHFFIMLSSMNIKIKDI